MSGFGAFAYFLDLSDNFPTMGVNFWAVVNPMLYPSDTFHAALSSPAARKKETKVESMSRHVPGFSSRDISKEKASLFTIHFIPNTDEQGDPHNSNLHPELD